MLGLIKALVIMLIGFAVLAPFASSDPDGLEKWLKPLTIEKPENLWSGLMPDYTLPTVENPYLSTVLAGFFGVLLVLGASFAVGKVVAKSDRWSILCWQVSLYNLLCQRTCPQHAQ